ncbi:CHAT domain-containing protein [Streptomyces sp. NPDC007346]|uniref:CHAT domain-containing protein n=1 Tax=Streptomyces sp. NPDC007346 TaxID=3154682 RepID=UPI003456CC7E
MRDALLRELGDRVRDFGDGEGPEAVLDEAGVTCASELMAMVGGLRDADTDILHTVAAYYWARSLARSDPALSAAELTTAMRVFGLLYLVDHRRVPRELWPQLTEETGHDPWQDPVDHASDLVLDVDEGGDPSVLDEALDLLRGSASTPYRDTTLGLALCRRAQVAGRPEGVRREDADSGIELLTRVAALPEESPTRRARRRLTLAEAHSRRFALTAEEADLAAAEAAARSAFAEAPEGSAERAGSAERIGVCLGHRAETALPEESVARLREAVSWLRLAVDIGTASGQDPDRANLARATGLLLRRTAQPGEGQEPDGQAEAVSPGARPASSDGADPARDLAGLGSKVIARVITEAEAVRQVVDPDFTLSQEAVASVVAGALRLVGSGTPQDVVPVLTLTLEAASVRWGTGPGSPWWWAADAYVEAARLSLVDRPDGRLFQRAHDIVRTQIDALRAAAGAEEPEERDDRDALDGRVDRDGPGDSDGRDGPDALDGRGDLGGPGDPAGPGDPEELAETLFAAGLLHLSPYFGELPGTDFTGGLSIWEERRRRHESLHPGDPAHAGVPDMPPPSDAAVAAVGYLRQAAGLASGHLLGRVLKALAEALSFLAGVRHESHDREILSATRKAFDVLDPRRDPLARLYILRVLYRCGELALPGDLAAVLPVPLTVIRERRGLHEASCVFAEALTLALEARRLDLQARLLAAADRDLPYLSMDSHHRLRWSSEVHCLAGDRLICEPGLMAVGRLAGQVRSSAEADAWPAEERAATLLHLAAHADPEPEGDVARELIHEVRQLAPALVRRHADAVGYLDAVLAHDMGVHAQAQGRPETAAAHFASAAFAFALCRQTDFALAALDAGLGCVEEAEGPTAERAVTALIPASVFLRQAPDETVDWKLYGLYQSLAFRMSGPTVDLSVMAGIHQAAKGMDFTIAAGHPGALEFSARLNAILARARLAEAGLPGPLPDFEQPGGAETAMLYYLGSGEAEPDGGAETEVRNLQRAADRWVSGELRLARGAGRFPLLRLDEIQELLPPDTVLLSLFLGQIRHASSANPVMALHGMAVTREELFHRTMAFPAHEGSLVRVSKAGHTLNVSPAAIQVAGVRQEIVADPLHRDVSRVAARMLADDSRSYLAGFTESLPSWLTRGKTHLCVWPHGPLHYLPFPLLSADGRPLADDWTVTQVPSLSFLSRPALPPSPHRGLAAFAFDSAGTHTLEAHTAHIAASMGDTAPVLGSDATPRRFLAALSEARYVHVAAHGSHNEWAPWHQCLFLSPDTERGDDGRVFAHDILGTDLRGVELVTMSACESALGRFDINDNLHGLPAAFLQAGAAAIVGCLWPVTPDVATAFFGTLYERLALSEDRRTAFRTAQSTTRARHPAYRDWGAFCFIGDWRTATDHPYGVTE